METHQTPEIAREKRALIVEPNARIARILEYILKNELKYDYKRVITGEEALMELGNISKTSPFPYSFMFTDMGEISSRDQSNGERHMHKRIKMITGEETSSSNQDSSLIKGLRLVIDISNDFPGFPIIMSVNKRYISTTLLPNIRTIDKPFNASEFIKVVHQIEQNRY